jgi:hypothetical protein
VFFVLLRSFAEFTLWHKTPAAHHSRIQHRSSFCCGELLCHARFHRVCGPSGFNVDKDSWSYGSTAASYNVNQLMGVKQWTVSNTACTSTATPVYSESYLYNSKALVSSKTITTGG